MLVRDGKSEPLGNVSPRGDLAPEVEAPMVFVGYGLVIPEAKYDGLAGLDLKGKIAVYVNAGGPVEVSGAVKSHYSSGAERWAAFKRAGAIGIATIPGGRGPNGTGAGTAGANGGRGWSSRRSRKWRARSPDLHRAGRSVAPGDGRAAGGGHGGAAGRGEAVRRIGPHFRGD